MVPNRKFSHTFTDASEEAIAAAVYLRTGYPDSSATTRLLMAKTKLAPKKTISVVKLELHVLLGSRLATHVGNALNRPVTGRFFWTDNSCVRNWLRPTSSSNKAFVSHRVGGIQAATDPKEWHVPGSLSSSDLATRSSLPSETISTTWFHGPSLLALPPSKLPKDIPWLTPTEEWIGKRFPST